MFQFTHPGGVRLGTENLSIGNNVFQFTHPGGVRLVPDSDYSAVGMFQFTHPGGVRLRPLVMSCTVNSVSIHAPGRGATTIDFVQ